jgi:hypothetical protein
MSTPRAEALALYRRGLALSRQLTDPCARHYAFGRITHGFRHAPPLLAHRVAARRQHALLAVLLRL